MKKFATSMLLGAAFLATAAYAQVNMGSQKPAADLPFTVTKVADFNQPWRIAFLPDGRMLITDKVGARPANGDQAADAGVWLVTQTGQKTPVTGVHSIGAFNAEACIVTADSTLLRQPGGPGTSATVSPATSFPCP